MRNVLVFGCLALWSGASVLACTGDDSSLPVTASDAGKDATTDGATSIDATTSSDASDAGDAADAIAAPTPPYLLLSYNYDNYAKMEFSAYSLPTAQIAGNLQYAKY